MPDFQTFVNRIKDIKKGGLTPKTCPDCKVAMVETTAPRTFIVPLDNGIGTFPVVIYDVKKLGCPSCGKIVLSEEETKRVQNIIEQQKKIVMDQINQSRQQPENKEDHT